MIRTFLKDERGATAIEYALIGSLISILIVSGATNIGTRLLAGFEAIRDAF